LPTVNSARSRWWIRLGIVLLLALGALFWVVASRRPNLEIENRSEQTIAVLNITIGEQTRAFPNVPSGRQVEMPSPSRGEEAFRVDGKLADGTRIRANGRIADTLHLILLPGGQLEPRRKGSS
jgi:hypothetical protein